MYYFCINFKIYPVRLLIIFSILLLLFCGLSCNNFNNEECTTSAPLNPNGDSELALLMREMFEDGERMKQQIKNGKIPEVLKKFETIHTAKATQPEKANSEQFKVFADSYLATVKAIHTAQPEEVSVFYKGMVETCMNCHQAMCPGPMVRIKKLYFEN